MNLAATICLHGYGTSEGVRKEWDTRGRKVQDMKFPAPKGAKTGKPFLVKAYHAGPKEDFGYDNKRGVFFSPEATPEFGDHIFQAELHFKNPLVAGGGESASRLMGDNKLAHQFLLLGEGVDDKDELLNTDDLNTMWYEADTRLATLARKHGYDGIIFSDHDELNPVQYQVLSPEVFGNPKKVGAFDWESGMVK